MIRQKEKRKARQSQYMKMTSQICRQSLSTMGYRNHSRLWFSSSRRDCHVHLGGLGIVAASKTAAACTLLLESLVVFLEGGDAALDIRIRVRGHLNLDGFEADVEMLELIVIMAELLLSVKMVFRIQRTTIGVETHRYEIRFWRKMMRWAARSARSMRRPCMCWD